MGTFIVRLWKDGGGLPLPLLVARGGGKVPTDCSCKFEIAATPSEMSYLCAESLFEFLPAGKGCPLLFGALLGNSSCVFPEGLQSFLRDSPILGFLEFLPQYFC